MKHVLVVEDIEESRYLLQTLLEGNGYRVTVASNGADAMAAALRHAPPDVVVSDALMPVMDGFNLCRAWMQDASLRAIPFIFYSATYTTPDDEKLALALGAARYLVKPLEADVFLHELEAVLRSGARAAFRPSLDDAYFLQLHESTVSRKLEDKVRQLEAANRELRADKLKLRGIFDSLQDVYVETDLDGKVLDISPQIDLYTRGLYRREEFIGKSSSVFYQNARDRDALLAVLREKGRVSDFETAFVNRDGTVIPCSVSATLRVGDDGKPYSIASTMRDITERKRTQGQIASHVAELERAFMGTVKVATTLVEMRDPYTAGHERRVAEIAVAIGAELGLEAGRLKGLRVAGYLHDVGKIAVPAEILSKPTRLTATEYQLVQGHAQAGFQILKDVDLPWPVAQMALQHHERLDGSGYPQGLKGAAILLEARILAVADVIEAMASHRPYRPGLGIDKALAEIERGAGTAYDPTVADACLKLFREKGYKLPA